MSGAIINHKMKNNDPKHKYKYPYPDDEDDKYSEYDDKYGEGGFEKITRRNKNPHNRKPKPDRNQQDDD